MRWLWYLFLTFLSLGLLSLMGGVAVIVFVISSYGKDLPDYKQLKDYQPPVVTRIYAGSGQLVAEYAQQKRVFVPVENMPDLVKDAFIAAEDQHFYHHSGVDYTAIIRAVISNIKNRGSGKRPVGASTITQQVAKNLLVGNALDYRRKIREAILAFRMEQVMSKDRILEIYLNEIYLGEGNYGVAAAALNYFNKPLEQLDVEEAAYLAILPKAPNNYNPAKDMEKALERRNWAIGRMEEDRYITADQAKTAKAKPLIVADRRDSESVDAPYFAEEVRRELMQHYGADSLYEGGLAVRTSLNPALQVLARDTLRDGLEAYDRRHGWRGAMGNLAKDAAWSDPDYGWWKALSDFKKTPAAKPGAREDWMLATVLHVAPDAMTVGLIDKTTGTVPLDDAAWAQTKTSGPVTSLRQVFSEGDVIHVAPGRDKDKKEKDTKDKDGTIIPGKVTPGKPNGKWSLRQLPKVSGAVVVMDPHTGRVLAIQGGWSYAQSEFDRATQALRQPGSSFKPFVYLTALENGFTPATRVLDGPFVGSQGPGMPKWAPKNYHNDYLGPTPLRVGIEKSRNLMTVRLANFIGMDKVAATVQRFGVMDNMPTYLSYALGAGETTLLRLTTGYAQFVNGGHRITPTFIDRIQDRRGKTIFAHDTRPCQDCGKLVEWTGQPAPNIPDTRPQIADPRNAYQIVSILEGVVQRGTGAAIGKAMPDRPLGGKTGTTNDSKDAWFIGFSPDLVVGVFIGFDHPKSLGHHETGATAAIPVFEDFMMTALKDEPPIPFRVPPGIHQVLINARDGTRANTMNGNTIWEAFVDGTEPGQNNAYILDDAGMQNAPVLGPMPEETGIDAGAGDGGTDDADAYTGALTRPAPTPADSAVTGTGGFY